MDALSYTLNFVIWGSVVGGLMWATHSRHVCDGILIKIGLASLAIGAAAQAMKPTFHSQLWIGCSLAAVIFFFLIRMGEAKIKGRKPKFVAF